MILTIKLLLGLGALVCMGWVIVADVRQRKDTVPIAVRIGDLLATVWMVGYLCWLVVKGF